MPRLLETRILLVLGALNLLAFLDRYLIAALASQVMQELALTDKAFGFLGTGFFLVYLVTSPVFGHLGDRWSRRRLMAAGAALWSLATSLTFWVGSYPALVAARGLVGVGEASFGTLAPAYLADLTSLGRRARVLGWFYLALPVGSALAYLLAGLLGGPWGWRPLFLLAGFPGLVLAALTLHLPAAPPLQADPPRSAAGDNSRPLWRIPTLRLVNLGFGMVTFALGGLAFWMPRYLEVAKGLSLSQANLLLFAAVTLAGGLGTVAGGFLGDRLLKYTLGAPLWVSGLGVALALPLAAAVIFSPHPTLYGPALMAAVFLLFLNPGVLTAVVVSVAGPRRRARAVALNIVVIHLVGDVPSPFLIGWASDLWGLKWGVSLTLVALAAGAALLLAALPHFPRDLAAAGELPGGLGT